jgi:hypothetical protein
MPELFYKEQSIRKSVFAWKFTENLVTALKKWFIKNALEYELKRAGIGYEPERQFFFPVIIHSAPASAALFRRSFH